MLTIATYYSLMSAELAKTRLEFYDIKATIADAFFFTLGYGSIMDGVRLQVADEDAERAKEILLAEKYADLSSDIDFMAGVQEDDTVKTEAFKEPGADAASSRFGGWPVWLLFLFGILCLILGQPADDLRTINPFSGQLILLGEILIVAGLWITYGRLSAVGKDKMPPE